MATSEAQSYGFIGLGVMGWGMAHNIIKKLPESTAFTICEVVTDRRDKFIAEVTREIAVAETPLEAALSHRGLSIHSASTYFMPRERGFTGIQPETRGQQQLVSHTDNMQDIIITMLPTGEHVKHVFLNPENGLLALPRTAPGAGRKLFIDCSTIDVKSSNTVAQAVEASKLGFFADAPVSGSAGGAEAGTLTFMVGASTPVYDLVQPIVANMGKNVFHCGEPGAGLATKQINNYMSAVNMIGVCEGMNMGRLYGLDPKVLAAVVNVSTGQSHNSREQNPVKGVSATASSANGFKPGFTTELCRGVLEIAMELQEQLGAKSVLAPTVRSLYGHACESDKCRNMDFRSIYKLFSEDDGMDLPSQ